MNFRIGNIILLSHNQIIKIAYNAYNNNLSLTPSIHDKFYVGLISAIDSIIIVSPATVCKIFWIYPNNIKDKILYTFDSELDKAAKFL